MNPSDHVILLAEDGEPEILLLKRAFQEAGVENPVQVLRDGQEAIDFLGNQVTSAGATVPVPALLLLDLKLPRKSGLEVLKWVRAQPLLKRLVVVVMSGSGPPRDINQAYDLGCNSFILKPLKLSELIEMARLIDGWWLRANLKPDLR